MNFRSYFKRVENFFKRQRVNMSQRKTIIIASSLTYLGALGSALFFTDYGQQLTSNTISNTVKSLSTIKIPTFMRNYVYTKYSTKYGVDLEEIEKPLQEYETFSEFFTRKIKPRPELQVNFKNLKTIACPADSQILNISKIIGDENIIIKDIKYSMNSFLFESINEMKFIDINELKTKKQNEMYQVIFYLCPGDYHRFHSPTKMIFNAFRNVEGRIRPVNIKSILKNGSVVYEKNARSIMHCSYFNPILQKNLYLGMVMIGALNVSDIVIYHKEKFEKGQQIGYFNLGSTIVMLIQTNGPPKWNKNPGDKVKYGQNLCELN